MEKYNLVHGNRFWDDTANSDNPYGFICDGFTKEDFTTERDSLISSFNPYLKKTFKVLDVGCGFGRIARWVAPKVGEYVGVDYSEEMIKHAKDYNKDLSNVTFIKNDGKDLSGLKSNSFDIVVCEAVFIHMPKQSIFNYFDEIYRVLKPEGVFYCWGPKQEHYINGLTEEELLKATSSFINRHFMPEEWDNSAVAFIFWGNKIKNK